MIRFEEDVCRTIACSFAYLSKPISFSPMPSFLLISTIWLQCTTMSLFFLCWKGKYNHLSFYLENFERYVFLCTIRSYFQFFNTLFWHPHPTHQYMIQDCDSMIVIVTYMVGDACSVEYCFQWLRASPNSSDRSFGYIAWELWFIIHLCSIMKA